MAKSTNKRKTCPRCERTLRKRAFTRDGTLCNICVARDERQAAWLSDFESEISKRWDALNKFQRYVAVEISAAGGISTMAQRWHVNPGEVHRVVNGGDSPKLRQIMHIFPETEPTPVCPDCGHVHEQKATCPHELQKARTRPPRIRSHYEHGRGDAGAKHKAQLQAEWEAAGCDSFTEYVDYLRKVNDGKARKTQGNDKARMGTPRAANM